MSTAFAAIVGAMTSALQQAPAVSPQVHRARIRPLPAEWSTAVVVRIQEAELDRLAIRGAPINVDTTVVVECYARNATLSPDLVADSLLQAVYARLAADPTLGGLVADCQLTGLAYDFDADADRTACVTLNYLVRHRTASLSLE